MTFVISPLYIAGLVAIPILTTLVTLLQGILIIIILVGALKFGLGLGKLISSGGGNAKVALVIRQVVMRAAFYGMVLIVSIIVNIVGLLSFLGPWSQFIFWGCVHFSEAELAHTLMFTKLQQKSSKIAAIKTASSASSVEPVDETEGTSKTSDKA